MQAVAYPAESLRGAGHVRTARLVRALALVAVAGGLILAGLALAAALAGPAPPPIQAQEPAVTSPAGHGALP